MELDNKFCGKTFTVILYHKEIKESKKKIIVRNKYPCGVYEFDYWLNYTKTINKSAFHAHNFILANERINELKALGYIVEDWAIFADEY